MSDVDEDLEESIALVREWIEEAEAIAAITGAGISTESGIPDFRGPQGLWTKNPELERMATLDAYMGDPALRERAWQSRLDNAMWQAKPNAGHFAFVELEQGDKLLAIVTQNVDGLHQAAGSSPERVIEIHGTIHETVCMRCGDRHPMSQTLARVRAGEPDPPCEVCGGILKSATIAFGQNLVEADLWRAQKTAESCDLMLAVGSSLSVYPAAGVVPIAKSAGARVVIVNAQPTEMDGMADAVLRGPIGALLPRLVSAS